MGHDQQERAKESEDFKRSRNAVPIRGIDGKPQEKERIVPSKRLRQEKNLGWRGKGPKGAIDIRESSIVGL